MQSDFLLIRQMKQGDEEACDIFIRTYYPKILSYCCYHCADQAYAEDLTQETFVRFFVKLSDYHHRGKTLNYLYTIAGNLCKDDLKKKKELPVEDNKLVEEKGLEEYETEHAVNRVLLQEALSRLPEELRQVLTLYYFEDLKLTEISKKLKIGLPLVKYRLRKARKQLEQQITGTAGRKGGQK